MGNGGKEHEINNRNYFQQSSVLIYLIFATDHERFQVGLDSFATSEESEKGAIILLRVMFKNKCI
jgi:hypothetical protein